MNKFYVTLSVGFLLTGISQAALISAIDGNSATTDWSNEVFTGSVTTTVNNWGHNDNFTNAVFTGTTMNIGSDTVDANLGNQPFIFATITNANFSGATFNLTPHSAAGAIHRFNAFRNATGSGADFSSSVWNFNIIKTSDFNNTDFFNNGAGAANLAAAAGAYNFSGADFNFSGTGLNATNQGTAVTTIINNLGSSGTGATAFGAKYDAAFTTNNFAVFGFADAAALNTNLQSNGWQLIPEPTSAGLLALGLGGLLIRRRRNG